MPFVVDSSVALAWLLPDEHATAVDALADRLATGRAVAPALWLLEIGNALLTARRRNRLADRDVLRLTEAVAALPIDIDVEPVHRSLPAVMAIAGELRLTSYDAAYVELARRRGLPLATLDARLAAAARKVGLAVLP